MKTRREWRRYARRSSSRPRFVPGGRTPSGVGPASLAAVQLIISAAAELVRAAGERGRLRVQRSGRRGRAFDAPPTAQPAPPGRRKWGCAVRPSSEFGRWRRRKMLLAPPEHGIGLIRSGAPPVGEGVCGCSGLGGAPARPSPYPYPCIHIHRVSLSRTRTVSTSTSTSDHIRSRPCIHTSHGHMG